MDLFSCDEGSVLYYHALKTQALGGKHGTEAREYSAQPEYRTASTNRPKDDTLHSPPFILGI